MELALSLGSNKSVDFCMGPSSSTPAVKSTAEMNMTMMVKDDDDGGGGDDDIERREKGGSSSSSADPTAGVSPRRHQLDLLPFSPVPRPCSSPAHAQPAPLRFPWLSDNLSSEPGSSDGGPESRIMDVNRRPAVGVTGEEVEDQSSPNSGTSSFMEFSLYTNNGAGKRREYGDHGNDGNNYVQGVMVGGSEQGERGATTSRGSDDEENGSTRKKLRLSKEQSAFLEESFKEHHTLNPKQKLALAKQLNLRPRQVEVWFQNRRARTKLKQTEVDCEYLKRCCETLTEENRRLQKELQELRALKSSQPFFMQLPATTLTMCPSCERVAPTSTSVAPASSVPTTTTAITVASKPAVTTVVAGGVTVACTSSSAAATTLSLGKPTPMLPFSNKGQAHQAAS